MASFDQEEYIQISTQLMMPTESSSFVSNIQFQGQPADFISCIDTVKISTHSSSDEGNFQTLKPLEVAFNHEEFPVDEMKAVEFDDCPEYVLHDSDKLLVLAEVASLITFNPEWLNYGPLCPQSLQQNPHKRQKIEENSQTAAEADQFPIFHEMSIMPPSNDEEDLTKENIKNEETESDEKIEVWTRSKEFPCKICGQPFRHRENSTSHSYTHMNWNELKKKNIYYEKCKLCQKVFFNKRNYTRHLNHHNKVQPHQCTKCQRKFTQREGLEKHILYLHSTPEEVMKIRNSWKNECKICGKKFSAPSNLATHKLTHLEKKTFKCFTCNKEFKSKYGLTKHQLQPQSQKFKIAFKCEICEQLFCKFIDWKKHCKLSHSNS